MRGPTGSTPRRRVDMNPLSQRQFDVCIVGGGPAGSVAALRLALLGHRVCLIERCVFPRRHVGELLTRGIRPILDSFNLSKLVLQGALTPRQCRVLWSAAHVDVLTVDQLQNWLLVDRGEFDALLLRAAASAGVSVLQPATVRAAIPGPSGWRISGATSARVWSLKASYLVDASGRAGFLRGKRELALPRTIAICGYLRRQSRAYDILVEALPDCWCWGAPLPGEQFSAMVFVDADRVAGIGRERLPEFWRSQLGATQLFAGMSQWPLVGPLLVRDATPCFSAEPIGAGFVRVGDSSCALDPLSSTGVEKAMQTANIGGIAVHTLLRHPDRTELCARFYRDRHRESVAAHRVWAAEFYSDVSRYAERPFWRARSRHHDSAAPQSTETTTPDATPTMRVAEVTMKTLVRLSNSARFTDEPCIVDDHICPRAALTHPNLDRPVAFLDGVALWPLLHVALSSRDVRGLIDLWSARIPPCKARQIVQWLLDRRILEAA